MGALPPRSSSAGNVKNPLFSCISVYFFFSVSYAVELLCLGTKGSGHSVGKKIVFTGRGYFSLFRMGGK